MLSVELDHAGTARHLHYAPYLDYRPLRDGEPAIETLLALPLGAQRLGLDAYAPDLTPMAALINKAMIEIPPRFAGKLPVNAKARNEWGGLRNECALSGDDSLAKGHGCGTGAIWAHSPPPEGGDLRHSALLNAARMV